MKKIFTAVLAMTLCQSVFSAEQIIRTPDDRNIITGLVTNFTGPAPRIEPLFDKNAEFSASGAYVNFAPSARSNWHTHPRGQILIVTEGTGYTQEWGKPVRLIRAGDVVECPGNVKHWHGASQDSSMTHLAITPYDDNGKNVEWMEPVTDEQYLNTNGK
ncbi:cupin domain-containing protein [Escherichia coli]|nr:cupin domain-containing protein [Escherichia coli]EHR8683172.1 cupin domain-containing protein [Escherichia coli]EHR8987765.1 cupin domain-containing protein [Escherichia coli]EHR9097613.1 cupin domain-containing protein [Escherichia coli]EHR9219565.1 cupin domain-containing protein [Escherichia coli]